MNVLKKVKELRDDLKNRADARRVEQAELKKVYQEELKNAKYDLAKERARADKKKLVLRAREEAEAGGALRAKAKRVGKFLQENRKKREAREKKRGGSLPMFQ